MKKPPNSFAAKVQQIEKLVGELEAPNQSLESALSSFERGIKLLRSAQEELTQAEQVVQLITEEKGSDEDGTAT